MNIGSLPWGGTPEMNASAEHRAISVVPKDEETIEGWRAFLVTALNSEGHVIRWSLYERSPDPMRHAGRLKNRLLLRAVSDDRSRHARKLTWLGAHR